MYNQMVALRPTQYAPRVIGFVGMDEFAAPDVKNPLVRPDGIDPALASVGCVLGIAVGGEELTSGEIFAIEAGMVPGRPGPELTGLHGQVLNDSLKTAWAYITTHEAELGLAHALVQSQRVHVHLKRAWQKREGPSAGAAIMAAMVSALADRPARQSVAVTGAMSLKGDVLGVGAVPAKIVAAFRHGCSTVIVPRENADEVSRIPSTVADGIRVVLVDRAEEVIEELLLPRDGGGLPIGSPHMASRY